MFGPLLQDLPHNSHFSKSSSVQWFLGKVPTFSSPSPSVSLKQQKCEMSSKNQQCDILIPHSYGKPPMSSRVPKVHFQALLRCWVLTDGKQRNSTGSGTINKKLQTQRKDHNVLMVIRTSVMFSNTVEKQPDSEVLRDSEPSVQEAILMDISSRTHFSRHLLGLHFSLCSSKPHC